MSGKLGQALKQARSARKLTAKAVGAHVGVSAAAVYQWEAGSTEPETGNLVAVADLLGIDPFAARNGEVVGAGTAGRAGPEAALPPDVMLPPPGQERAAPPFDEGNRDVPVHGVSVGGSGDEADFSFNGQVIDHVRRPPGIARRKDVFVVEAVNDSMSPAIEPGDPQFIDPNRQARPGENVVVELYGEADAPGPAYLKRLVRRSASKIVVRQFNPDKEIEFEADGVKRVWRVIPLRELLGAS